MNKTQDYYIFELIDSKGEYIQDFRHVEMGMFDFMPTSDIDAVLMLKAPNAEYEGKWHIYNEVDDALKAIKKSGFKVKVLKIRIKSELSFL